MVNWITAILKKLVKKEFYGELLIKFEHGKIVLCKKTETLKYKE